MVAQESRSEARRMQEEGARHAVMTSMYVQRVEEQMPPVHDIYTLTTGIQQGMPASRELYNPDAPASITALPHACVLCIGFHTMQGDICGRLNWLLYIILV
jgi:hypothetical protein